MSSTTSIRLKDTKILTVRSAGRPTTLGIRPDGRETAKPLNRGQNWKKFSENFSKFGLIPKIINRIHLEEDTHCM